MTLRLTLICHAATSALREAAYPADEPLDAQGEAKAMARASSIRRVDAAWTSPALRARQTAAALGLSATVDPALRDIDLGCWAGRPLADVVASDPAAVVRWTSDPASAPHGGESVADLVARVGDWLGTLAGEGSIVAVTHAAVIRAVFVAILDANQRSFWRIDVAPLGSAVLHGRAGLWTLRSLSLGADAATPPSALDWSGID